MAAILELKFFNSFWLKKLDTLVDIENTTGILNGSVSTNTIVLTNVNLNVGVGQTVTWDGAVTPFPTVYKKVNDTTFILNKVVTIANGETLSFGPITDFTYMNLRIY